MKSYLTLVISWVFLTSASIIAGIPEDVEKAFKEKFPKAKKVEWIADQEGYEFEFRLKKEEYKALFNEEAEWIYTAKEMDMKDFPVKIKEAVQFVYQGYTITEVYRVTHQLYGECYGIELEKPGEEVVLLISDQCQELNSKMRKVYKEEKSD